MKKLIYLVFAGVFLSAWAVAGMALWPVIGPWRLGRFLACRIGYHGRTVSAVNAANRNTEMRCTVCHRFLPNSRRIPVVD